ncbi:MAG: alpha/beta fold hydrolase [Paracoccaceae bacterium]
MTKTILIPGLLCDQTVWQPLLDRLGGQAFVAMAPDQDTLTGMAAEILKNHDGPLSVLGHSMGARIAMEMARQSPDRVLKLGLFDTGAHPLREGETKKRAEIVKFAFKNGMKALSDRWLPGMIHPDHQQNPRLMRSLEDMVLRMTPELHARQINALVHRPDANQYLSEIACPVLLMVGRQDQWSPVSQHQEMLELLPDAHLEVIENAGHFSLLEQPELTSEVILNFLK